MRVTEVFFFDSESCSEPPPFVDVARLSSTFFDFSGSEGSSFRCNDSPGISGNANPIAFGGFSRSEMAMQEIESSEKSNSAHAQQSSALQTTHNAVAVFRLAGAPGNFLRTVTADLKDPPSCQAAREWDELPSMHRECDRMVR